jgi:hypothetical protein
MVSILVSYWDGVTLGILAQYYLTQADGGGLLRFFRGEKQ